jgi:hypothetical protein
MSARHWLISGVLFSSISLAAAQIDTTFILNTEELCLVGLSLQHRDYQITSSSTTGQIATYQNAAWSLGARIKYKRIGISLSVPILRIIQPEAEGSKQVVFRLNAFPEKFILESSIRLGQGFAISQEKFHTFDPGMHLLHGNVSVLYPANKKRFSLRSSFRFMDRQIKSGGTTLFGIKANYETLHTKTPAKHLAITEGESLNRYRNIGLGAGVGYGYTFTRKSLFLTGVSMANLEAQRISLTYESSHSSFRLRPDVTLRFAIGYNARQFFTGIHVFHSFGLAQQYDFSTRSENSNIGLTLGWRMQAPNSLRKLNSILGKILRQS